MQQYIEPHKTYLRKHEHDRVDTAGSFRNCAYKFDGITSRYAVHDLE